MIRYALRCAKGHDFEGWFRSADDFERMQAAGQVACTVCEETDVQKALMTPGVPARKAEGPALRSEPEAMSPLEQLRRHVEANSDYVGMSFAAEARAMHEGTKPERAIHGEARPEEARRLLEDGIPVAPLPFRPRSKVS
ncbi:DUF1178 family protein [Paracoccus sp. Z118]|uniref:DUF1178 family protein n=1 Tax=Paracoccus sp. Z118 TaxID=2851017 RepID=UPI001C2BD671|nr:DUF1178 family protein [Paracoccus sp. Z118]MBV0892933.1 DUF1178 family protein [Paracoccus sp. Z118]